MSETVLAVSSVIRRQLLRCSLLFHLSPRERATQHVAPWSFLNLSMSSPDLLLLPFSPKAIKPPVTAPHRHFLSPTPPPNAFAIFIRSLSFLPVVACSTAWVQLCPLANSFPAFWPGQTGLNSGLFFSILKITVVP